MVIRMTAPLGEMTLLSRKLVDQTWACLPVGNPLALFSHYFLRNTGLSTAFLHLPFFLWPLLSPAPSLHLLKVLRVLPDASLRHTLWLPYWSS